VSFSGVRVALLELRHRVAVAVLVFGLVGLLLRVGFSL
jgi:hypothetical protein